VKAREAFGSFGVLDEHAGHRRRALKMRYPVGLEEVAERLADGALRRASRALVHDAE